MKSRTVISESVANYITRNFSSEDDFLRDLCSQAVERGMPDIAIAPEQTSFLQVMLKAMNARRVLEIGSLAGYSAIAMARALPGDGELIALELNPDYADFIRSKASEAGLSSVITVHSGKAKEFLEGFSPVEKLDFVFIDADKPNYSEYLRLVYPHVRKGGIICGDNCMAWGNIADDLTDFEPRNVHALQAFNRAVIDHPGLQHTFVPLGDGMTLGLKIED